MLAGRRSLPPAVSALLLASGVLVSPAGAAQATCERAERLARFDLAAARSEYEALLGSSAVPACAEAGFRKVSDSLRQVAALLSRAEEEAVLNRDQEALAFVAQALAVDPANGQARRLLGTLAKKGAPPEPEPAGFEGAEALWNAGYKSEAREQARKVAAEKGLAIPSRLGSPGDAIATRVKERTADVATYGSALAIVLVVLAAVVALVGKLWSGVMRRRFISLGSFVIHPADPKAPGDLLKAVVAEEFAAAARSSSTFRVVEASGVELPDFLEVPDQLKPIGKLLQVLFRRPVLTVSATARDRGGGAWQVTAQIATRRRVKHQETFEVPASVASELPVVGVFIAAWALCAIGSLVGWRWRRKRTYPLGTTSWRSLVGIRLAALVEGTAAEEEWLRRSMSHDPMNSVALAQLGFVESDSPADAGRYADGLGHLESAAGVLASRPTQRPRWIRGRPHRAHVQWEPLWFQISYLRTTGLLHRYYWSKRLEPPQHAPGDLEEALAEGLRLAQAIAATWLSIRNPWRRFAVSGSRRRELASMLEVDDEYYLGVLAGALVEGRGTVHPSEDTPLEGKALWEWLARFQAERDLGQLLLQATTPPPNPSVRTMYNIACVWTRIGHYREALDALRTMFARAGADEIRSRMAQVAEDPTLAPLRDDPRSAPALATMLAEAAKRAPAKELRATPAPAMAGRWTVEVLAAPGGRGGT